MPERGGALVVRDCAACHGSGRAAWRFEPDAIGVVNGSIGMLQDMAMRLAKAFPNTDIRFWLGLQLQYDAWQAEQRAETIQVARFVSAEALTAA